MVDVAKCRNVSACVYNTYYQALLRGIFHDTKDFMYSRKSTNVCICYNVTGAEIRVNACDPRI